VINAWKDVVYWDPGAATKKKEFQKKKPQEGELQKGAKQKRAIKFGSDSSENVISFTNFVNSGGKDGQVIGTYNRYISFDPHKAASFASITVKTPTIFIHGDKLVSPKTVSPETNTAAWSAANPHNVIADRFHLLVPCEGKLEKKKSGIFSLYTKESLEAHYYLSAERAHICDGGKR
jgi:hypothetical protein